MEVRFAEKRDLEDINDIYNYFVSNTHSTFDTKPFSLDVRKAEFEAYNNNSHYNFLVAVENNKVIGWACNSKYREHEAFDKTSDLTVYIHYQHHGKGVGAALYVKLFELLARQKYFHSLLAAVALPNEASIQLHKKFGMEEVGIFKEYASKNGRLISSMWLQKILVI